MSTDQVKSTKPKHHHSRDSLSGLITGSLFILAGAFIFAENQGMFYDSWFWWFLLSAGIVFIIEAIIRIRIPRFNKPVYGIIIKGSIISALGASQLYNIEDWWPVILIITGSMLIFQAFHTTSEHKA